MSARAIGSSRICSWGCLNPIGLQSTFALENVGACKWRQQIFCLGMQTILSALVYVGARKWRLQNSCLRMHPTNWSAGNIGAVECLRVHGLARGGYGAKSIRQCNLSHGKKYTAANNRAQGVAAARASVVGVAISQCMLQTNMQCNKNIKKYINIHSLIIHCIAYWSAAYIAKSQRQKLGCRLWRHVANIFLPRVAVVVPTILCDAQLDRSLNRSLDRSFDQSMTQSLERSIAQSRDGSIAQLLDSTSARALEQSVNCSIVRMLGR